MSTMAWWQVVAALTLILLVELGLPRLIHWARLRAAGRARARRIRGVRRG